MQQRLIYEFTSKKITHFQKVLLKNGVELLKAMDHIIVI